MLLFFFYMLPWFPGSSYCSSSVNCEGLFFFKIPDNYWSKVGECHWGLSLSESSSSSIFRLSTSTETYMEQSALQNCWVWTKVPLILVQWKRANQKRHLLCHGMTSELHRQIMCWYNFTIKDKNAFNFETVVMFSSAWKIQMDKSS